VYTQPLLHDALRRSAKLFGDRPAVSGPEGTLTYRHVWRRGHRVANALRYGLGLPRQSRFAVLSRNAIEYPEIVMGAALADCVCVPIDPRLEPEEVSSRLADSEALVLVSDSRLGGLAERVLELGFDGSVWWTGGTPAGRGDAYDERLERASTHYVPRDPPDPAGIVLQVYSAGTTDAPKGVMLSHRNLRANALSALAERTVVPSDVSVVTTPLSHIGAMSRMITSLHAGATILVRPAFDPDWVLDGLASGESTSVFVVPEVLRRLVARASAADRRGRLRFRRLSYGGSHTEPELIERVLEVFQCELQQGYGLTEASPTLTTLRPEDHVQDGSSRLAARMASVGTEAIGVEVRVVDDGGTDVEPGEPGEVIARGPNVMEGYWRRPKATVEAIRDDWLHTGDVAVTDEGGFIFLVDRKADVLISGGFNVYPREIEAEIERSPLVREVGVVGRPDPGWGEIPVAFVALRSGGGGPPAREDLAALCRERLAAYKVPREYRFVRSLPRNTAGRILKRRLREELLREPGAGPEAAARGADG
jgi:acyl-CoA synthetase (AMP-forming)/AMP-acid ligase II